MSKGMEFLCAFGQRFLRGLPQLDPVLDAFAASILTLCDQYDTLVANAILASILDFINGTCMETEVKSATLIRDAARFPWYLRDLTGIGKAYAFGAFPKSRKIAMTNYIQAVSDMNYWIVGVNDLLSSVSFYNLASRVCIT